ncbi:MAG: 5'/3'-nucleotidase SurE [Candidatus Aminicenantes bacterium]|nr:5'/3'-nucleotidase SurE [Candidatus Aminicenantes bacterium]
MKTILLTNDDGFRSPGLTELRDHLKEKFRVFTIAPATEMSAVSMALSLNRPLRVEKIDEDFYSVDGTPSDCVNIALRKLMKEMPDFVISGMNLGENLSEDIIYSGTVGAATSAYFYGIPALAVSLISDKKSYSSGVYDVTGGINIVDKVLSKLLPGSEELEGVFNLNIPYDNNGKIIVTTLGNKRYKPDIIEREDPRGKKYFWIGTGNPESNGDKGTDIWAIKNKYASISPLMLNLNCFASSIDLNGVFDEI